MVLDVANMRSGGVYLARVAVILLLASLILGIIGPRLWASRSGSNHSEGSGTQHVVAPGESLWGLAGKYAPEEDPRSFVFDVKQLNGLDSSTVSPGQKLIIPSG